MGHACLAPPGDGARLSDDVPITNRQISEDRLNEVRSVLADPQLLFASSPIFDGIPGKSASHAPSITALPEGDLLAAWYSYVGPRELNQADIYLSRRAASNQTWSAPVRQIDRLESAGNPALYNEGSEVWLFHAVVPGGWSTAHVEQMRSHDGGETWEPSTWVSPLLGSNVRGSPLRTAAGVLLLPAYDDLLSRSLVFRSDDGASWTLASVLDAGSSGRLIQPVLAATAGGDLLLMARNTMGGSLWTGVSHDDGQRWEISLRSGFANPGAPVALLRLSGGPLLIVYNDSPTMRSPLVASVSLNDGLSWTSPRVLAEGDGDWAYPAAAEGADGVIEVVYSHNRQWIQHVRFNLAWLLSPPGSQAP